MSSVHEIESEIEETRSRLNDTIDRIQDKLTVSGLVDEVMGAANVPRFENGPEFVMGFVRRNPIPVMVAAAALGWFVYRMNRRRALEHLPQAGQPAFIDIPVLDEEAPDSGPPPAPTVETLTTGAAVRDPV